MVVLGIDYGERRTGIAMSDNANYFAYQYKPFLGYKDEDFLVKKILELVSQENIEKIVIGIPYGIDQKETKLSIKVRAFIEKLKAQSSVEIVEWDETGTSKIAISNLGVLAKKRSIDSESARIILQEYLDHMRQLEKDAKAK